MQTYFEGEQVSLFAPDTSAGRTYRARSARERRTARISELSWRKLLDYIAPDYQFLDLSAGAGNLLGRSEWTIRSALHGGCWLRNTGPSPRDAIESFLSQILQAHPPKKYYLTTAACLGILRRAKERGKPLPQALDTALRIQAGLMRLTESGLTAQDEVGAYHINQRNEGIDLGGISGALLATQNMQMQTFVTSGVITKGSGEATLPPELHGTLSCGGGQAGQGYPCVLTTTFPASDRVSASTPAQEDDVYCIIGNIIDRQPENGGNGFGYQADLAYTLTAMDRHAVFARQRVDAFRDGDVASTQSARQAKDATDLVVEPNRQYAQLIRRLTPLECERLQGFPDGWTNIPGASDSARYRALGNSVYLIMVVMRRTDVKTAPGEDSWRSCFT